MSKRIPTVTRQLIEAAIVPLQTKTYTVIPHADVINITEKILGEKGFVITTDKYKCTKSAQVAQGVYHLDYGDDPEMKMMFAWSNSYDKSLRFRCGVGGRLENGATILSGANLGSWARRHSGNALQETTDTIKEQIDHAGEYYAQLVHDKESMKQIPLGFKEQSEMAGRLFVELNLINTEQVSDMKNWIRADRSRDNLWTMYEYIVTSLQKSHPAKWMDAQIAVHYWVTNEFNIPVLPQTVSQTQPVVSIPLSEIPDSTTGTSLPKSLIEPYPGHQVTLEESIAEVTAVTGEPLVIEPVISVIDVMKDYQIEVNKKTHAHDFNALLEKQRILAEAEEEPIEMGNFGDDKLDLPLYEPTEFGTGNPVQHGSQVDVMAPFPITQDIPGETDGQGFELPDPNQPHIFTVEKDEDEKCFICGKVITDEIHEPF